MLIFNVRSRRCNFSGGCGVFKYFSTIATFYTLWYRSSDGLVVKTPFSNRHTRGWLPNVQPSGGKITKDKVDRVVLIALYDRLLLP